MFTLAHLSDPHLPMPPARPGELLNKRATGWLNWWRRRAAIHLPEALAGIVADIKEQKPDHIALTGDLVNVSLAEEYRRAADWLAAFDTPDRITVIPGNHDVYVPTDWSASLGLWGAYMAGDGEVPAGGFDVFPTVRRRGPKGAGVALVGLSTGVPKPPLLATGTLGAEQLARAERLLGELGREGLCRVVLIHHPPLAGQSRWKRLTDAAEFQAMIRRAGCELVLHGHNHRSEVAAIGKVPVVGVTSASAAPDSHYGRARYHLIRIMREDAGWRLSVDVRALKAGGGGCEPDGTLSFHL